MTTTQAALLAALLAQPELKSRDPRVIERNLPGWLKQLAVVTRQQELSPGPPKMVVCGPGLKEVPFDE